MWACMWMWNTAFCRSEMLGKYINDAGVAQLVKNSNIIKISDPRKS